MDLIRIITELRRERDAVDQAVRYLEALERAQTRRRGRPPAVLTGLFGRKRKPFSEATRKKMALAQKKRWAAYRQAQQATQ
jgi:hypothetical protein